MLAVHAALLPTGKVLFFAGSGSSAVRFASPDFGSMAKKIFTSVVWDPQAAPPGNFSHPPTLFGPDHRPFDFFCGGDASLPDGRLLAAGGTLGYNPFLGRPDATVFDPVTEKWSFVASMTHGRWYPSLITLGDGRVLAATGLTESPASLHNQTLEVYSAATNQWQLLHFAPGVPPLPLYAHLFLLADGRVFFDGGHMDDVLLLEPCTIDLTTNPVGTTPVPGLSQPEMRNQSASVILPPAQDQRIMLIGGGPDGKPDKTDAIDNVDIVDFRQAHPHLAPAAPLSLPRLHLNAVLLPDRTVFVTGGSLKQEDEPLARLQSEIYDPAKDEWTLTAASTVPRLYHSTALLLPDGRVVAAGRKPGGGPPRAVGRGSRGGDADRGLQPSLPVQGTSPVDHRGACRVEVRPGGGDRIAAGRGAAVGEPRPERRHHPLLRQHSAPRGRADHVPVERRGQGQGHRQPERAPPGWYMLFLVNDAGVPSVARWIHLT